MSLRIASLSVSAIALVTLAGCGSMNAPWSSSSSSSPSASSPPATQICNAQPAQSFIGRTNTAQNLEQARKRSGAAMARVLHPGQITTREFNAERLNLEVDATGRIIAVRCG